MSYTASHDQPQRRSDGEQTHAAILDQAVRLASIEGVGQITIGRLAEKTGISKSGVYAHFRSKERLQLEIVQAAEQIFAREVIGPGLDAPTGLARLRNLYFAYIAYVEREVFPGGCFFAGLIGEFDARQGPIHDAAVAGRLEWESLAISLVHEAQASGELARDADPAQLVFQLDAVNDHTNFLYTLHRDPAYLERGRAAIEAIIERARP